MAMSLLDQLEYRWQCRFEAPAQDGMLKAFPVTHVIDGTSPERYAAIEIKSLEHVTWCIYDENGQILLQGVQHNFARTKSGYIRAIRGALEWIRCRGKTRRVYPRNPANRRTVRPPHFWGCEYNSLLM